jgi:flagellar biogenesis protein FliO
LDSPLTAIGDGGRMLMTMLPVLLLIVGGLHLLRRWQQRTGRLPGLVQSLTRDPESRSAGGWKRNRGGGLQALLGAFQQSQSTGRTGGIRLVESLPLGGANLHVVEVRGRALLLGVTGASVQTLAELTEPRASESNEFMAHLQAATADLDALDLEDPETPIETLVGSLESVMQETHAAVNRRVRRLRTVRQEDEDADAA